MKIAQAARNQTGFTLIEILIVIIIIGILLAVIAPSIGGKQEDAKVSSSNLMLKQSFPQAIGSQFARTQDCASITKADLEARGLNSETPFGDAWTLSNATAAEIEITFPVSSANDSAEAGADINTVMQAAIADGANSLNASAFADPDLTITYQCR